MKEARAPSTFARARGGPWAWVPAVVIAACSAAPLRAQDGTVQGRVHDDEGAAVFGAFVTLLRDATAVAGTDTDRLGSFRISSVGVGSYTIRVAALGYAEYTRVIELGRGETLELDLELERAALELQGIAVEAVANRERARFEEIAGATVRELDLAELRAVPGVAEADPLRAVEVLPGVVSTSDFSAAFHVRGGSADQNLILLDGVPVFSPFHLGGLFSVFNADMIDRVELQSGGFAAEHGGRVSSVLEVDTDVGEGGFGVDSGISLLATRAAAGGRLPNGAADALGQSSIRYRASARRSYFDVVAKPWFEFPYHLTDFQLFLEGWSPSGDRITLTAYTGRDVLDLTRLDAEDFPLRIDWDWGNDLVGLQWTHPRSGGGAVDVRANFS
ncbi:MAG TPA: carboxypeptidase regulatory-like domain-containing protein, partial [Longimicrobiales bacterium]|nr:carboxypeptidase regulatory-like domain-containing protein [Longimicrobiales bacterium]